MCLRWVTVNGRLGGELSTAEFLLTAGLGGRGGGELSLGGKTGAGGDCNQTNILFE